MRSPFSCLLLLACTALPSLTVHAGPAEHPATTAWRTDIATGFARYERAWAAHQLARTSAQYDVGDEVAAGPVPASQEELFSAYRFTPVAKPERSIEPVAEMVNADGTRVRLCLSATLRNPDELAGFLQGLTRAKAGLASSSCQPGALASGFAYPVQLHAYKTVRATRAAAFIERDQAERAAQAAVADTIGFALPEGKLLDMSAAVGQASTVRTAVLQNTSALPWSLTEAPVAAPFSAALDGCVNLPPGATCTLTVMFSPVASGRFMEAVTLTPVSGKTLSLRVGGTAP
jgi:hypothetical protein